ncbi:MAG: hypothetical protein ACXWRZ_02730 [Bdellovibrio sp.]
MIIKPGLIFIICISLCTKGYSQTNLKYSYLIGSSARCESLREKQEIKKCKNKNDDFIDIKNLHKSATSLGSENLSDEIKKDYFAKIKVALSSHFKAATWLSQTNPLDNGQEGSYLQKTINSASTKCKTSEGSLSEIKKDISTIHYNESMSEAFGNSNQKEIIAKKTLVAWIEVSRINRLIKQPFTNEEEKTKLKQKLSRIKLAFPLVGNSNNEFELSKLEKIIKEQYRSNLILENAKQSKMIDDILFSPNIDSSKADQFSIASSETEYLVKSIFQNPLNDQSKQEINSHIVRTLADEVRSLGAFCELTPCQTMQLDLNTTGDIIKRNHLNSQVYEEAACSCNLMNSTEYVSGNSQFLMAGGAIGGLVLCPITFGLGCYGAAAASAALALSSAANTVGAIKDRIDMAPLVKTADSLPGLSSENREGISDRNSKISKRIVNTAMETFMLPLPGIKIAKKGTKILNTPAKIRPSPVSTVSGDEILESTKSQLAELKLAGIEFEKDTTRMTAVEGEVKDWPENINYNKGNLKEAYYGEFLKIKKLPPPGDKGTFSNALNHPEMREYFKKMKKLKIDLVVDTSLRGTSTQAYYSNSYKVIALQPETSWLTFLHEFQHAQFDAFITPRIGSLKNAVQVGGRSIKKVLPKKIQNQYSDKELARLEKLLKQEHTDEAINESMSTSRELDTLGWKKYIPVVGQSQKIYGAKHRVNSLSELNSQGIELTAEQKKSLVKARTEIVLTYAYNIGGVLAAPVAVIKGTQGAYEIIQDLNILYNDKSGDMIAKLPDGTLINSKLEVPKK